MRHLIVSGAVLLLLLAGGRLWGDTAGPPGPSRRPLVPGQPAPDFAAPGPDGTALALRDYRGRPIIINFWATWCAPCRQELLALQRVYEAYKTTGLTVLALSQDHQDRVEAVRAYWTALGLTFFPLLDPGGRVATHYSVFLLPSTVFVHPSGTVAAVHLGALAPAQIERYLQAILPPPG